MPRPRPARIGSRRLAALATAAAMGIGSLGVSSLLRSPGALATTFSSANLLSGDQANFDGGTTGGWAGNSASVSNVSSPTQAGSGALAVTTASAGDVSAVSGTGSTTWTPAIPGAHYTGSLWLEAAGTGRTVAPVLVFYSSSGATVGSAWGQASTDQPGSWSSPAPVVGIAPANTAYAALAVMIYGTAANEVHYLDTASLNQTSSSDVVGPLHTSGNVILDGNNHPVTLRGLNRPGMENSPTPNISQSDIDHAKQWGANFIRVPLSEAFWLTSNCHYDPTYASKVDSMVSWITSRGMVALLDLHTNTLGSCGPVIQQMMADNPGSITFWNQVAARYKSNNLVAFDLYNEPHDISDSVWRNGGWVNSQGTWFRAAGMQQLYNAVRSTGATNLVVASGTNWGFRWPSTAPLTGNDIVYGVHAYTCPLSPPPNCTTPNYYDPSSILNSWVAPSASNPVMVTEFGWPDHFNGIYNQNVISFAEA
ncbi:MAG TPA: cellulase family glycosylhydrolase, partial [Acidimicrobiales bacterium]|nr:cellulase family glycosylhydrolase [Acidimicrobiales bacterium]